MDEKWTVEEMKALIDKVLADATATKKKFSVARTAAELNWDELKIDTKSNESCQQAFKKMSSWVFKQQTVKDVAAMVKTELEKSKIPLSMVPAAPKKPMTAFFLFCQDKYGSLKKKNPGISVIEANKLSQQKWAALSPSKKDKYQKIYQFHKAEYDSMQATFTTKKEKTAVDKKKGRTNQDVLTPFDLYYESTPSESKKQEAKQTFEAFDDNRKIHWIWSAIRECNKLKEESDLGDSAENGAAPLLTPHLKDTEKRILLKSEGIHEKPPKTLLAFYRHKNKDSIGPDKVDMLNEKYRNLDDDDVLIESLEYLNWMKTYTKRVAAYLSKFISMKSDERDDIEYHTKAYQKLITKMEVSIDKQKNKKAPAKKAKVKKEKKTDVPETKKAKAASPSVKKEPDEATKRALESLSSDSDDSDEEVANKSVVLVKSKSKSSKSPKSPKTSEPPAKKSKSGDEEIDEKTPVKKEKKRKKSLLLNASSAEEPQDVDHEVSFKAASASKGKKSRKSSRS